MKLIYTPLGLRDIEIAYHDNNGNQVTQLLIDLIDKGDMTKDHNYLTPVGWRFPPNQKMSKSLQTPFVGSFDNVEVVYEVEKGDHLFVNLREVVENGNPTNDAFEPIPVGWRFVPRDQDDIVLIPSK